MPEWLGVVNLKGDAVELFDVKAGGAEAHESATGETESRRVPVSDLPKVLPEVATKGEAKRLIVGIPARSCLCGRFEGGGRRRTFTELTYLAEQLLPWSAEDCCFFFQNDGPNYWFAAIQTVCVRPVLKAAQQANCEIIAIAPLPILVLASPEFFKGTSRSSDVVRLCHRHYGGDVLRINRAKRSVRIHDWTFLPSNTPEGAAPSSPDLASFSRAHVWTMSDCLQGAKALCSGRSEVAIDFLTDPHLSEFRLSRGEKNAAFVLLLLTFCMVFLTAVTTVRTQALDGQWTTLSNQNRRLLEESLSSIPDDRRTLMLAKSHRNQMRGWYKAAMQLPKLTDPELPLVQLLQVMMKSPGTTLRQIKIDQSEIELMIYMEDPGRDQIMQFQRLLEEGGFDGVKFIAVPGHDDQMQIQCSWKNGG